MNLKILPVIALLAFAAAPVVIGSAEQAKKDGAVASTKDTAKDETGKSVDGKTEEAKAPARKISSECLASEEVIQDLETREKSLKQREEALKEKEKDIAAQTAAVKEEMNKLEGKRAELQGIHQKEMADREEQVNKLIETFEGMSPKAAAQVMGGVDDELAVMALSKLSSAKAGKILSNLKPEKSSHLSELMAYGKTSNGKESSHGESESRTPASKR